jgi:ribosome-binding factor A
VVSKARMVRIADRMREVLSELLIKEIQDPRLLGISITDVEVDRELAYATIFFSSIEGESRAEEVRAGLEHAQGFLRSELAQRIQLRVFPRLRFRYDPTFEQAEKIERLFTMIDEEKKSKEDHG